MTQLHLVNVPTTPEALDRILEQENLEVSPVLHDGAAKTLLAAAFTDLAPGNFLWTPQTRINFYSPWPANRLLNAARRRTNADLLELWGVSAISSQVMPNPWRADAPYEFVVKVMPTRRLRDPATGRQTEVEIVPRDASVQERDEAYEVWLAERIEPWQCANLDFAWMVGYRPGPIMTGRRGRPEPTAAAYLQGEITVTNRRKFNEMLLHGIGRHRNRGYGMMLLGRHCDILT